MNTREKHKKRARRTRAALSSGMRPRLSVFISNSHIYAQIVDDTQGKTLVAASDADLGKQGKNSGSARAVGELVASRAKEKKIKEVVFDRGGRKYHGKVKALAEGARKELVF